MYYQLLLSSFLSLFLHVLCWGTASNTPSTCPTKTSPSLVHPQVPSTSVARDPGIAVPPTSNNPGTTLPSTSSSDS